METNDFKSLLASMKNLFIANMTRQDQKVTDLNEGSIIMTEFESVANILEQAYIDTRLGFQNNLNSIATSVFDFKRKEGQFATVQVKFSRAVAMPNTETIIAGTIVSDGTHNFTTSQTATIPANELDSNLVNAQAAAIGTTYNVPKETINNIVSVVPSEVIGVTNPNAAVGGADQETEADMLARFKVLINGLQGTNKYGLEAGLLSNPKIRSVSVVEHPEAEHGYHATVYIDDGTGSMSPELKDEVLTLINGDETSTTPGLRATGINMDVQSCTRVSVDVSAKITLYRVEDAYAAAALQNSLEQAINGLKIGEDVIFANIMTAIKQTGSFIQNVKNLALNSQENIDININENQIARLGAITFTYVHAGDE